MQINPAGLAPCGVFYLQMAVLAGVARVITTGWQQIATLRYRYFAYSFMMGDYTDKRTPRC
jgi:hypothetical protein